MKIITYPEAAVLVRESFSHDIRTGISVRQVAQQYGLSYYSISRFLNDSDGATLPHLVAKVLQRNYTVVHYNKIIIEINLGKEKLPIIKNLEIENSTIVTLTYEQAFKVAIAIYNELKAELAVPKMAIVLNVNVSSLYLFLNPKTKGPIITVLAAFLNSRYEVLSISKTYFYELS